MHLIATGGDDNALGLTLLCSRAASASPDADPNDRQSMPLPHHAQSVLIPQAHAAAVTGLKFTGLSRTKGGVVDVDVITVGNDQRVKVWVVRVDMEKATGAARVSRPEGDSASNARDDDQLLEAIQVAKAGSAWTSVADVSGLAIIEADNDDDDSGESTTAQEAGKVDEALPPPGGPRKRCKLVVVGVGMELLSLDWC
jgi:hypothetical protein